MTLYKKLSIFVLFILLGSSAFAQISPGELSNPHAYLEGVSNCTKCHDVGNKVTREKCLACHDDIRQSIVTKKGYHASSEVTGKACMVCHNEHHGKNFQIIRFDKKSFNHAKSGFELKGQHAKEECKACHKAEFISDPRLKKKASTTYLGLKQECLTCHFDYHQGKLSNKCTDCHGFDSFKKATGFDHSDTRYPLLGKHRTVVCLACHKTEIVNGKKVQKFTSLPFANCTPCHEDVHKNKFGQNCKQCHTEESFFFNKSMKAFDHDKTNFKLIGEHKQVECKECHKKSLTAPLKHDQCKDCHADYHKGEFAKNGVSPDCNQCHTNNGFTPSTFTIEQHNKHKFKLEGAHLATACAACHKKEKDWTFQKMGHKCVDCHTNVHKGIMDEKFIPNENCKVCHNVKSWKTVTFDHNRTDFKLIGAHTKAACAFCHYRRNENGIKTQKFGGTSKECSSCHRDSHFGQFAVNGKTDCTRCHGNDDWHDSKFDHNTSRFKLDGAHAKVKCEECHKTIRNGKGKYIEYKFDDISCSKCHT
ncbi:MAG: cytochrome C [Paludibacter sp.]